MGVLTYIDVNSAIRTDEAGVSVEDWYGLPRGGINRVCELITYHHFQLGEDVVLAFDSSTDKRVNSSSYKNERLLSPRAAVQEHLLELLLPECRFTVFKEENYDAFDLISSHIDDMNKSGIYSKFKIVSDDVDLCCCLAKDVEIISPNNMGLNLTVDDYEGVLGDETDVAYNTILAQKVLMGSDKYDIAEFRSRKYGLTGRDMLDLYVGYSKSLSNKEAKSANVILEFFEGLNEKLSEEDLLELSVRVSFVYPKEIMGVTLDTAQQVRVDKFKNILIMFKLYSCFNVLKCDNRNLTDKQKDFLYKKSAYFKEGYFEVDHNISPTSAVSSDMDNVNIGEF